MTWSLGAFAKISTGRARLDMNALRRPFSARSVWLGAGFLWVALALTPHPAHAAPGDPPYDEQYMRLAEILGGLHHLRPLCGANEPQLWRDKMNALITAENPSPDRRKRLIDEFNRSYRSIAEIYRDCTPAAQAIIERYLSEGARISEDVLSRYGRR